MTSKEAAAIEARTQALGHALLDAAERYSPGLAERIEDWLLTRAVADDHFRTRLLRYLDVLSALDPTRGGDEAKRLAQEYFDDEFPGLPRPLRWLIRIGRDEHLPAVVVGETAQRATEIFARRFITPPGDETIAKTLDALTSAGRFPSFDLLGEAVQSEAEAEAYVAGYLALLAKLGARSDAHATTAGGVARLQVSLKLSSLTSWFTPVDFEGTIRRVRPALEAIALAASRAGVGLTVDMEQYAYRDLAWAVFARTFARGERFGDWDGAGLVVQAYLRDAARHVDEVVAFAQGRGAPIQIRLVKGAYWDYETIVAREAGWPSPVFARKVDTDAQFERVLAPLVAAHPHVRLAVASHNARSHAIAEAMGEARGLPAQAIEHQTLFHTAEGMSEGLVRMGWIARDYVPVGELPPGMAYLVRRVLENSSQTGFLLQSRAGVSREQLLAAPPGGEPEPPASPQGAGAFQRAVAASWFQADWREACERALAEGRAQWGWRQPLSLEGVVAAETVAIPCPSHPEGGPIGYADFAGADAVGPAVTAAKRGLRDWGARSVDARVGVLRRAAALLEERQHAFAAQVVHEGGRERVSAYAEVEEAIDFLAWYAAEAERLFARLERVIEPRGVVAVIPPWNFPLSIPCGMTAAALACGNAVILKPAEQTPLVAGRFVELLWEAGVPRTALIHLPGRGETVGAALAGHPDVAMIAFTGSRAVGTALHEIATRVAAPDGGRRTVVAEMGGKNPILVFADADLDEAVAAILPSAFGHAGQRCSAASRVLVERSVFGKLRDRLALAARSLPIGAADDAATRINPVIDREAWNRLQRAAETARREGEVVLDRFDEPAQVDGAQASLNLGPLIVTIEPSRSRASESAMNELFGPILVLIPFDDEDQAYALANETGYGLTAGVFTRSPRTLERALDAVEAGNLYVNRTITGARVGVEPFGGLGLSGTGPKAGGPDTLVAYVRRQDAAARSAPEADSIPTSGLVDVEPGDVALPAELGARWSASVDERIELVERAAASLEAAGDLTARGALLALARQAREELGAPRPTLAVAGQHTELRAAPPRGLGLVHARGPERIAWLVAPLFAGNAVAVVASPGLEPVVEALVAAGLPGSALACVDGGSDALLHLAASPRVAFVATDAAGALSGEIWRRLGPTASDQPFLKALFSPADGPQPGEPGFLQRFAWAKTIAVRTLRHGADLGLEDPPSDR